MALDESRIPALVAALAAHYPDAPVHELGVEELRVHIAGLEGWQEAAPALTRRQAVRILTDWIDIDLSDLQRLQDQQL